jgi:hypothetical protein
MTDCRYFDDFGCPTLAPFDGEDYQTENPHLFSGEFFFLNRSDNTEAQLKQVWSFHNFTQVQPGLFRRRFSQDESIISHDEYLGKLLLISARALPRSVADDICKYGKSNWWSYNDKKPNQFDLIYVRQPRDIYLYKIMSRFHRPSYLLYLLFCLTALWGVYAAPDASHSGKVMWWFRLQLARRHGRVGILLKYIMKKFNSKYKLVDSVNIYYKDPKQPTRELANLIAVR